MADTIYPGNATPAQVLAGQTYTAGTNYNAAGTMPNNGKVIITPGGQQTIPQGYHDGTGYVAAGYAPGQKISVTKLGTGTPQTLKIKELTNIYGVSAGYIQDIKFLPDGSYIVLRNSAGASSKLEVVYFNASGTQVWKNTDATTNNLSTGLLAVSQNGQYCAALMQGGAAGAGTLLIITMSTGVSAYKNTGLNQNAGSNTTYALAVSNVGTAYFSFNYSTSIYLESYTTSGSEYTFYSSGTSGAPTYLFLDEANQLLYIIHNGSTGLATYPMAGGTTQTLQYTMQGVSGNNRTSVMRSGASDFFYYVIGTVVYKWQISTKSLVWSVDLTTVVNSGFTTGSTVCIVAVDPQDQYIMLNNGTGNSKGVTLNASNGTLYSTISTFAYSGGTSNFNVGEYTYSSQPDVWMWTELSSLANNAFVFSDWVTILS